MEVRRRQALEEERARIEADKKAEEEERLREADKKAEEERLREAEEAVRKMEEEKEELTCWPLLRFLVVGCVAGSCGGDDLKTSGGDGGGLVRRRVSFLALSPSFPARLTSSFRVLLCCCCCCCCWWYWCRSFS